MYVYDLIAVEISVYRFTFVSFSMLCVTSTLCTQFFWTLQIWLLLAASFQAGYRKLQFMNDLQTFLIKFIANRDSLLVDCLSSLFEHMHLLYPNAFNI